jgi:ribonuclease-3
LFEAAAMLAARLDLPFRDVSLLAQALVHSSYVNERPAELLISNDRLEFLGDAVIGLVFSDELVARYPTEDEGALTTRRSAIVSAAGLARLAQRVDLGEYVQLGEGAARTAERQRASVLAGCLEAVVGAIYLDLGLDTARTWLLSLADEELSADRTVGSLKAPKSLLQEATFARSGDAPVYRVVSAEGPDHRKEYVVEVSVGGVALGRGQGSNRRDAETAAAREALGALSELPLPTEIRRTATTPRSGSSGRATRPGEQVVLVDAAGNDAVLPTTASAAPPGTDGTPGAPDAAGAGAPGG